MGSTSFSAERGAVKMVLPLRPEPGKPLGRHVHHDPRSRDFPAERASEIASIRHHAVGLPLTQAEIHTCSTAHSLCGAINCGGDIAGAPLAERDAVKIYETATAIEPFTLGDRVVPGSSGLMACKAARRLGTISSYHHAFGIDHALRALTLRPVMTGFTWYRSFDSPDPLSGLVEISATATARGGHEVVADEIDVEQGIVWFWNSWGPGYGSGGRFCMTFDTWARLLEDRGDVTVPIA